jgi:photolyase PhrII
LADSVLPRHLQERTRLVVERPVNRAGRYLLYWMRTAMRAVENPALDVALVLAQQHNLPLLVYQGLSQRYPYANDRHHLFIMQGARDVAEELRARGINYVLHLERPNASGPYLRQLADNAAWVVTEEMPVDPLRRWTHQLATHITAPVCAVDTACIVPMSVVGQAYDRAFAFRRATHRQYAQRVPQAWEDVPVPDQWRLPELPELPFTPVDLANEDFATLLADCEIDHSIGPVPDTIGGSRAGYARWNAFVQRGLNGYARKRNNPVLDGASRMSAYLHYGMVSPFQLARTCHEVGNAGAEKYLDELLIWREMAYVFCFYRSDHARFSALPAWARETLDQHARDSRPARFSWETLARGETGEALWDAAQKSLLIHGELHNNVRMTWGKALLNWRPDPRDALRTIIDLNHRYALDGRDPASYGGILWCLGQFDRPFPPAQPVLGTVRGRSLASHAERMNVDAYRKHTTRPLYESMPRVAVIGAGLSGLACARTLADHGLTVEVFEKSRGTAGRMATRRAESYQFDHGAQYFTCRSDLFRRYVNAWTEDNMVSAWEGRVRILDSGELRDERARTERYVGVPSMSALGKHLARAVPVRNETQIVQLRRDGERWYLSDAEQAEHGPFDLVVVAVPAPQAAPLLQDASPALASQAAAVRMRACWAVMAAFDARISFDYDGAFVHDSPLAWVMRDSSKPRRPAAADTWVLHASGEWTDANLETSAADVQSQLLDAFWTANRSQPSVPAWATAHRWLYALPTEPHDARHLWDASQQLGACGDWCGGPRVEGAFLSGVSMAGRVLRELQQNRSPAKVFVEQQQQLFE